MLTSVSAAYVQRNLRPKVTSLTVHPAGTVFQKPYPTGDPDIAGFDDQAPDRRILSATPQSGRRKLDARTPRVPARAADVRLAR